MYLMGKTKFRKVEKWGTMTSSSDSKAEKLIENYPNYTLTTLHPVGGERPGGTAGSLPQVLAGRVGSPVPPHPPTGPALGPLQATLPHTTWDPELRGHDATCHGWQSLPDLPKGRLSASSSVCPTPLFSPRSPFQAPARLF